MARRIAVQLGLDDIPAATVNRFCASSVQTARMAFHAIKAGEGHAFVSAGVECVSRYTGFRSAGVDASQTRTRCSREARTRTERTAETQRDLARPADRRRSCPTSTSRWARPRRTSPPRTG